MLCLFVCLFVCLLGGGDVLVFFFNGEEGRGRGGEVELVFFFFLDA